MFRKYLLWNRIIQTRLIPAPLLNIQSRRMGFINLIVYSLLGEKVVTLINENLKAGKYEINFNASSLANGVYF